MMSFFSRRKSLTRYRGASLGGTLGCVVSPTVGGYVGIGVSGENVGTTVSIVEFDSGRSTSFPDS